VGSNLEKFFFQMGARLKHVEVVPQPADWRRVNSRNEGRRVVLDIKKDRQGWFFEIRTLAGTRQELLVLNAEPRKKHLLLLSRQFDAAGTVLAKQKFLCGQDERRWFVAAIPEDEPVSTVAGAQIALKPKEVRLREEALGIRREQGFRRRNAAFVRQGEWFFVPARDVEADPLRLLQNEPLSRGNGSKAHWAGLCYRSGGETVYVSAKYPSGLTATEYKALPERERNHGFRMMKRDAAVYVRGEITHPDHKTVHLEGWHRVFMNTENRSMAMRFLAFLD
jgi:hypothetical protein